MVKAIALAATLASLTIATTPASAAILFDIDDGGFVQSVSTSPFVYDFQFVLPTAGSIDASLTSSNTKITFTSVTVNGVALTKNTGPNNYSLPAAISALAGLQTFHIAGSTTGKSSFSTSVSFISVVPEPAAWMLMVVGFGALGATMRRRPVAGAIVHA